MTNRELLKEIHRDNKAMSRNIQRFVSISLMGMLGKSVGEAKEKDDKAGKLLATTGLLFVVLSEIILLVSDFIAYRKVKTGEKQEVSL